MLRDGGDGDADNVIFGDKEKGVVIGDLDMPPKRFVKHLEVALVFIVFTVLACRQVSGHLAQLLSPLCLFSLFSSHFLISTAVSHPSYGAPLSEQNFEAPPDSLHVRLLGPRVVIFHLDVSSILIRIKTLQQDRNEEVGDDVVSKPHYPDAKNGREAGFDRRHAVCRHCVVHDCVPVLRRDDLKNNDQRTVPKIGGPEGIKVAAGCVRLGESKSTSEELHAKESTHVHEHDPNDGKRPQGPKSDSEGVEDLAHILPAPRQLEEPKQSSAAQGRKGPAVGVSVASKEASEDLYERCSHHNKIELVKLVGEIFLESKPYPLADHLNDEDCGEHTVDVIQDHSLRRIKGVAQRKIIPTQVPEADCLCSSPPHNRILCEIGGSVEGHLAHSVCGTLRILVGEIQVGKPVAAQCIHPR
mmetsp:Transcript_27075/g.62776  ORF Transcript_27075/g.62776 Transcript_27075/m.62776 type:complete len:413 (-) Transcript_27075:131-1369(-)